MNNSPYKFLDFYGFEDKDIFFGRESESNILVADVVVNRLVVLFARTGTGKTSLINAGVRPRLEEQDFKTFYIRVEQHPTEAARDVLIRENLLNEQDDAPSFSTQLISVVNKLEKPIVLFFDQFEEFFIQISNKETRRNFVNDIAEIYRNADSGVHFVFSMREEYFHEMDEFRAEIPSIFHKNSNLRLLQLNADQAKIAIINPAKVRKVEVEEALADKLIEDLMQDDGIRPTNLQIICDTLWRHATNQITANDYYSLGGAQSILNQRLSQDIETTLSGTNFLPLMQRLIPELRTEKDTKYPRVFSDLVKTLNISEEALQDLISRLKSIQVVKDTTISGAYGIEWASDYLAERTKTIAGLIKTIELKGILQAAMKKASADPADSRTGTPKKESPGASYLSVNDLEQFSQNTEYLTDLRADEIEFLFDTALLHQRHMWLWFDLLSKTDPNALDALSKRIHNKQVDINLRKGAINLLDDLGTDSALRLLEEALDEPDLSDKAIDAIIEFPGDNAIQLLSKSLERDDLWEAITFSLAGSGSERAVALLSPFLQRDARFFQALNALERLAKSSGQAGFMAEKILESVIPDLEERLKNKSTADSAGSALVRLSKFREPLGSIAKDALGKSESVQEVSQKSFSERIKDLPTDRGTSASQIRRKLKEQSKTDYIEEIAWSINKGEVIPIISNSFRIEQIFRSENELADQLSDKPNPDSEFTISEQLTKEWANSIQYPMIDEHNLARVAQFYQVEQRDILIAKTKYLNFLSQFLLEINKDEEVYREQISTLQNKEMSFSEIARWLDYPRFPTEVEDPLRLLARFPLSIYVTTSYYDFLEQALRAEMKNPRTQVLFWSGGRLSGRGEHAPDRDYVPSISTPAVYHIYGLENYPQTLVLSEDDYLNFLISVTEDMNTQDPIVPLSLREALAESRLLLIGYRQWDTDFRFLDAFIKKYRRNFSTSGIIQVFPQTTQNGDSERTINYLRQYFDNKNLRIEWDTPEKFIQKLWDGWNKMRRA